jgi:hypothetical protein
LLNHSDEDMHPIGTYKQYFGLLLHFECSQQWDKSNFGLYQYRQDLVVEKSSFCLTIILYVLALMTILFVIVAPDVHWFLSDFVHWYQKRRIHCHLLKRIFF